MHPCWRCRDAPEVADLLGHDAVGHRILNALLQPAPPGPVRTVEQLAALTDIQLLSIRTIGSGAVSIISRRLQEAGWPGSYRLLSREDRVRIIRVAVDSITEGSANQKVAEGTREVSAAYVDASSRVRQALLTLLRLEPDAVLDAGAGLDTWGADGR